MSSLLEICLEEVDESVDERFIRCVAVPGGEPGLALDSAGAVRWMPEGPVAYGLWVSADGQLVLLRGEGADPITVSRTGRALEAPARKPVILLDGDLLEVNGRQLRVHVHGATVEARPPERLSARGLGRVVRATAAALALGATVGIGGSVAAEPTPGATPPPIEVRNRPPAPVAMRPVTCTVTSIAPGGKGIYLVQASCPPTPVISVGAVGTLQDAQGAAIKDGQVKVTKVEGTNLTAEAKLQKPVQAKTVRFYVR